MSGVGDEMEDVGRAIERAEERTEEMEARSMAMDELRESGAFDDALSDKDRIDRELETGRSSREVDTELETLKSELGDGDEETAADEEAAAARDEEMEAVDEEVEAELESLREDERDEN
jgi:phage shock protein A